MFCEIMALYAAVALGPLGGHVSRTEGSPLFNQESSGDVLSLPTGQRVFITPQKQGGKVCARIGIGRPGGGRQDLQEFCRNVEINIHDKSFLSVTERNTVEDRFYLYFIDKNGVAKSIINGNNLNRRLVKFLGKNEEEERIDVGNVVSSGDGDVVIINMSVGPKGNYGSFRIKSFQVRIRQIPELCSENVCEKWKYR